MEGHTYIQQAVQLIDKLPFLVGQDEATKAGPTALVELRFVAEFTKNFLHVDCAFESVVNGVPSGLHSAYQDFTVQTGFGRQLRELFADLRAVEHLHGELENLMRRSEY